MEMCRYIYIYIYIKTNGYAKRIEDDETAAAGSDSARVKISCAARDNRAQGHQDDEHT